MKAILIIKTRAAVNYELAKDEIQTQMEEKGWETPIFVYMEPDADDYQSEGIEVVWLDEELEQAKFADILKFSTSLQES